MYNYTEAAHVTSLSGPMAKWHSPDIEDKENWTSYDVFKANTLLDVAGYKKDGKKYETTHGWLNARARYYCSLWMERLD